MGLDVRTFVKNAVVFFALSLAGFGNYFWTYSDTHFESFQGRDLVRAMEILNGHHIYFGPEITGGGNLWGPAYYYLLAVPLYFGLGWWGAWLLMCAMAAAAGAVLWFFLKRVLDPMAAFIGWIAYTNSVANLVILRSFVNISFVFLFLITAFCLIYRTFEPDCKDRERSLFFACLAIGVGVQFHFSLGALLLVATILNFISANRLPWPGFVLSALGFVIPVLPFAVATLFNSPDAHSLFEVSAGPGRGGDFFPAIWREFLSNAGSQNLNFTNRLGLMLPWPLLILGTVALYFRTRGSLSAQMRHLYSVVGVCLLVALPSLAFFMVRPQIGYRYQLVLSLASAVLTAAVAKIIIANERAMNIYLVCCAAVVGSLTLALANEWTQYFEASQLSFIIVCGLVLTASSYFFSRRFRFAMCILATFLVAEFQFNFFPAMLSLGNKSPRMSTIVHALSLSRAIYQRTGWSFEEARKRIYMINFGSGAGAFALSYASVVEEIGPVTRGLTPVPDGFVVKMGGPPRGGTEDWLLRQSLPSDVRKWIEQGELKFGDPVVQPELRKDRQVVVTPYYLTRKMNSPPYFQNYGYPYENIPEWEWLAAMPLSEGTVRRDGKYVFYWAECGIPGSLCTNAAVVQLRRDGVRKFTALVSVVGYTLSQSVRWNSPRWTESWQSPYLAVKCGLRILNFEVASSIGYDSRLSVTGSGGNNSLLAPYESEFKFQCAEKIVSLTFGRKGSLVEDVVTGVRALGPKELTYTLD